MAKPIFKYHNSIFVEKYRPKKIEDVITSKEYKEKFNGFIEKGEIPNLIFEGTHGVGKSSATDILISNIPCETKIINGSELRGIDSVREVITPFVTTSSFEPWKIVVLEEGDKLTNDAQDALKTVTEQYTEGVRFIITCNNIELLSGPLRSRFQEFHFYPPTQKQVIDRCKEILDKEKISYDELELETIVRYNFPDIRKCIGYLDQHSIKGVLNLDREFFKILEYEQKILKLLKDSNKSNFIDNLQKIRQEIANTRIRSFISLYKFLFSNIDNFLTKQKLVSGIIIIFEAIKEDALIPDKEINLITCIAKLLELKNE